MIKKSLLLTLLLALLVPWAAQAQETLTVYENETGTNSYVPIYGYYVDSGGLKCEYIIPAEELSAMAGGTISQMTFYLSSQASAAWNASFQVFVKEVDQTVMTGFLGTTDATVVYQGVLNANSSTMVVPFTTAEYTYEGGNLLVGFYITATGTYKSASFYGKTTTENTAWQGYSSYSGKKFIPRTTFTYTASQGPTCAKPDALTANGEPTTTEFSFTIEGGSGLYNIFTKAGDGEWTNWEYEWEDTEVNLTNLTPATDYQVRVQSVCTDMTDPETGNAATSGWKTLSFTTACGTVVDFPWSYDFENDAAGDFANPCWVNEHIEGSGTKVFQVSTSSTGGNSTHQLQLPDMAIGTLTKLVLPEMTLNGNYQFVLDVYRSTSTYNNSYPEEGIRVFASSDGEIEGATEITFIPRHYQVSSGLIPAEENAGWYTYELPIPMTGTCYIILRGESQYCTATYMDNFMVELAPTCLKPTNFVAANVTNHSATLTWTPGQAEQTAWQIAYMADANFDPTDEEALATAEVIDVDDDTYTFDKTLEASTHYYMYVRANCGDGDYSKWVGVNFTTGIAAPAPTNLHTTSVTPNSIFLAWNEAGGDFLTNYDVYVTQQILDTPNDTTVPSYSTTGNVNLMNITGVNENDVYYCYVRANHVRNEETTHSAWTSMLQVNTPEACPMPTMLTAYDPTPNSITLDWTEGAEWQYEWYIAYSTVQEFDPDTLNPETYVEVYGNNPLPYTVTGLDSETTYYFKVKGHCTGDYGYSAWTNAVSATTLVNCPVPTDLAVTTASNSATLTWNGYSDEYTVQYRTAGGYDSEIFQGFEDGMGEWTMNNCHNSTGVTTSYGDAMFRFYYTSNYPQYLISPLLNGDNGGTMSFYYARYSDYYSEYFKVGYSTTTNDPESFTWGEEVTVTNLYTTEYLEYTYTIPAGTKYVSIACTSDDAFYLFIDDITIHCGEYTEPGAWTNAGTTTDESMILFLNYATKYDAHVKANCGEEYSDYITFTTKALKVFTTEGNWDVAENWTPAGAPTIEDDVTIQAAATIPAGVVASANYVYLYNSSITIADGGQLVSNNNVVATVEKNITGYGAENYATNNGYYLIANPTNGYVTPTYAGLITDSEYDLYEWYSTYEGAEWRNYKNNEFSSLNYTDGYLYANQADVTLSFLGTVRSSKDRKNSSVFVNNTAWGAWNLLGNPFVCNAYLVDNQGNALPYYKMNANGNGFEAVAGEAIAPVTGIFYEAPATGAVYFTREAPAAKAGQLNMMVNQGRGVIDNAVIRFGEGQEMSKFSFRENSTKVYIPMDGKDYAIVNAGNVGEMPVNFKAEKNGNYTLSFTSQEVSFSYLRLVDNMTGNETNLLETPYYTFNALTTDYANRFKLVFATGSSVDGDSFAFVNGAGNLSIFGIEGEATVQVVDVLGHVLSSETFSGSYERKLNVAPGVYMIRLIQGSDVKVQKMVIR